MSDWVSHLGFAASVALPLFNIPLMVRMIRRKSSKDLSLVWVGGVWACLVSVLPSALRSVDPIFHFYSVLNLVFFTGVTVLAFWFRRRQES